MLQQYHQSKVSVEKREKEMGGDERRHSPWIIATSS
uniref:Uncharacterized protein n=1 Tax=Arundo donax TaxID=35708 RepID=A0A0A9C7X3_ARUDO